MNRTRAGFARILTLACLAGVALSGCRGKDTFEPVVIGAEGGSVRGPNGAILIVPPGAVEEGRHHAFHISVVDPASADAFITESLCGVAYLVGPSRLTLAKPLEVLLREPADCPRPAFLAAARGSRHWAAHASRVEGGIRRAELPETGIVGIGSLNVGLLQDTTVYVGSTLVGGITDRRGVNVNHTWLWSRTLNQDLLAPENGAGAGRQRAKAPGVAALTVKVPAIDVESTIEVRILPNPAARLSFVRGEGQSAVAGTVTADSLLVEVRDGEGIPVSGVWVDVVHHISAGEFNVIGGGPTDELGRMGMMWRVPVAGRHRIDFQVPGTGLAASTVIVGTAAGPQ
jgi:hypothetical protein